MWQVYEKKTMIKSLKKIPKMILKHYEIWKRVVELEGPQGLRLIKGFHDEALKGEWKGFRSSRLNQQWRVLYRVEKEALCVFVIDVNPHNYKRKK